MMAESWVMMVSEGCSWDKNIAGSGSKYLWFLDGPRPTTRLPHWITMDMWGWRRQVGELNPPRPDGIARQRPGARNDERNTAAPHKAQPGGASIAAPASKTHWTWAWTALGICALASANLAACCCHRPAGRLRGMWFWPWSRAKPGRGPCLARCGVDPASLRVLMVPGKLHFSHWESMIRPCRSILCRCRRLLLGILAMNRYHPQPSNSSPV